MIRGDDEDDGGGWSVDLESPGGSQERGVFSERRMRVVVLLFVMLEGMLDAGEAEGIEVRAWMGYDEHEWVWGREGERVRISD